MVDDLNNFRSKSTNSYLYEMKSNSSSSSSSPSVMLNLNSPISLTSKSPDSLVNFPAPPQYIQPPAPPLRPFRPLSPPSSDEEESQNSPSRASDFSLQNLESPMSKMTNLPPAVPPPPPPPAGFLDRPGGGLCPPELVAPSRPMVGRNLSGERKAEENMMMKPKLKPLHWDKVRASSDRSMVWDQLKASSFEVNEEMIETLFMVNSSNVNLKDRNRKPVAQVQNQDNQALDPKKSQNIAILLKALNVTTKEVCEALLEGNADTLGAELLESLIKMSPTKEEERKLLVYKDDSPVKLGPAEKFLKAVLEIPFAFKRVDAILYMTNFDSEVEYLKSSFETLETACRELKNSRMFMKLLEAVLKTGNRMNVGTNRGDAHAFKLDTLLKLVDVKGTDGKTTLLHFVVHEIIRAEGSRISYADQNSNGEQTKQSVLRDEVEFRKIGLKVVSGLSGELSNVKKAAAMDSDMLSSEVMGLVNGITKVAEVLNLNEQLALKEENHRKFSESMNEFLRKSKEEIINIQVQEGLALSAVKEITKYFHGGSANEEAHRFKIFMVVRDFLSTLDQVCRDVSKINDRTTVSQGREKTVTVNPSLPPVFPGLDPSKEQSTSDDDSSSSSSS
ncbi:hypothetical protein LIER_28255 [Lithospermum erythrorhizon]|uniref:Formin-like protein n=1 Tax=Lithospermum erythrorhizon TaxID=34254 RepID=A0AAV3RL27_LITER